MIVSGLRLAVPCVRLQRRRICTRGLPDTPRKQVYDRVAPIRKQGCLQVEIQVSLLRLDPQCRQLLVQRRTPQPQLTCGLRHIPGAAGEGVFQQLALECFARLPVVGYGGRCRL